MTEKTDRAYTRGQKKWIKLEAALFLFLLVFIFFFPLAASLATDNESKALFWSLVYALAVGCIIRFKMIQRAMLAWDALAAPLD